LDPEHCYRRVEQFLELPYLPLVWLCVDIVLYNYFSFFLRQDLRLSSSKTSIGSRTFRSITAVSKRNAFEHCTIQKVSLRGVVDKNNTAFLLSSVFHGDGLGEYHGFNTISRPRLEVYDNCCFLEFVFKPVPLLLEDQRSEKRSERLNQTMYLLIRMARPGEFVVEVEYATRRSYEFVS